MSTHEDAKDPKDLKGSESMKPDPEFQDFFDKLVGTGARNARLFSSASDVTVSAVDSLCKAVLPKYEEPTNPANSDALSITDTSRPGPYHKIRAIAKKVCERASHPWVQRTQIQRLNGKSIDNNRLRPTFDIHWGVTGLCE